MTPANPSAGSARSTAAPCGSRMPALGRISTRAPHASRTRAAALQPRLERLADDQLVGLDIPRARARDDVVGDRGRRRLLVPAACGGPVAHVLLVEARLAAADLKAVGRPVARGVGRQDLVADDQLAGGVEAELELGVGEDHAALARVGGGEGVQLDRDIAHALHQRAVADELGGALEVDRLVVADVGLGAWA